MTFSAVLRLARAVQARDCLGWSAIEVWAARYPGAHQVDVSVRRRSRSPAEVAVVCLARDGTRLARRRWYARRLGTDLAERLHTGTRLMIDPPGGEHG